MRVLGVRGWAFRCFEKKRRWPRDRDDCFRLGHLPSSNRANKYTLMVYEKNGELRCVQSSVLALWLWLAWPVMWKSLLLRAAGPFCAPLPVSALGARPIVIGNALAYQTMNRQWPLFLYCFVFYPFHGNTLLRRGPICKYRRSQCLAMPSFRRGTALPHYFPGRHKPRARTLTSP